MNRSLFVLLVLSFSLGVNAQDFSKLVARGFGAKNTQNVQSAKDVAADSIAVANDTLPHFPGGDLFLEAFIEKKVMESAQRVGSEGDVEVTFKVDKKGYIYGAEVTKSVNQALDTEAFNIVTAMPRWRPARKDGEPIESQTKLVISFRKN